MPRSEIRKSNTRRGDRHRLSAERVSLTHGGRTHEVELVNVSAGGAMVAGGFNPLLWDRVVLHLTDGGSVECVVRWIRKDRVGLQFAPDTQIECSPEELRSLLRDVVARSFPELGVEIDYDPSEMPSAPSAPRKSEEHRREERLPLIWRGTLHYDFTSTPVRFRNISRTGALVECEFPLPLEAEPLLEIGDAGSIFATVSWQRQNQMGLKFKEPFDLSKLSRSRPEVAPAWRPGGTHPSGPGTGDQPLTARELREHLEGFLKR